MIKTFTNKQAYNGGNFRFILKTLFSGFAILFLFAATTPSLQAQPTKQWDNTIGGDGNDYLYSGQQTKDGGYILGGRSDSNIPSGDKTQNGYSYNGTDFWLVKLDVAGRIEWDKTIGGNSNESLHSVQQTADGGYILGGSSHSNISGDKSQNQIGGGFYEDFWVVKLNAAGVKEWDKTFGGSMRDRVNSIQQTADGGFILGGFSDSDANAIGGKSENSKGKGDYWIIKINAAGTKEWDRTLGGSNNEEFKAIRQTTNGSYIVGGYSESNASGDKSDNVKGFSDYWIVKLNAAGLKEWDKSFGGSDYEQLGDLQATPDGGCIMGGWSLSPVSGEKTVANKGTADFWVVKLNAAGHKEWDNTYGGAGSQDVTSIHLTKEGGYILGGKAYSYAFGDKTENSKGLNDFWVVKINEFGQKEWDKTLGGDMVDELSFIQQTADGGFFMGGISHSNLSGDKSESRIGSGPNYLNDYWVVKLSAITTERSITTQNLDKPYYCTESEFSVSYSTTGTFSLSEEFQVQLSNVSGSFTSPVIIGTGNKSPILARIPYTIPAGEGYRIRVVSSLSPIITGSDNGTNLIIKSPSNVLGVLNQIDGPLSPCPSTTAIYSVRYPFDYIGFTWTLPSGWSIQSGQGTESITVTVGTTEGDISVIGQTYCGSDYGSISVKPLNLLTQPILITASATSACAGNSVIYTANQNIAGNFYNWTVPNGWTILSGQGTHSITVRAGFEPGNVHVIVSNPCGAAQSQPLGVSTSNPQTPTVAGMARCGPGIVTLTASGAPSTGFYRWYTSSSGGAPFAETNSGNYTATLATTTTYFVSVVNNTNCESPRVPVTATVNPLPVVLVLASSTTLNVGGAATLSATGANSYIWSSSTGLINFTGPTVTVTPTTTTTYTVTGTNSVGCSSTASVTIMVNPPSTTAGFPIIKNSIWKYHDKGVDLGTGWTSPAYDDAAWSSGAGVLGYGDPVTTTISFGPSSTSKYPSYYFRKSFDIADASIYSTLVFNIRRDDGAVVYLNGEELFRTNMPAGAVSYHTFASSALGGTDETTYYTFRVPAAHLKSGRNVVAVSVHQDNGSSSDMTFDLEVNGETAATASCTATGTILREVWNNISGTATSAIPVNTSPTEISQLTSFEAPSNIADNYGQRIRGYICAPATGSYTFYIAGDDDSELWLSTNDSPANKQKIAAFTGWTNAREWSKYPNQKSTVLTLQANTRYYIEALHKEGSGGDNLAVGWVVPNTSAITVIPGAVLSPFSTPVINQPPTVSLTSPSAGVSFTAPATITLAANATDADGTVSKVEFFQGAIKLGEDLTAPYTYSWSNVAAGTYVLTAKATDNSGISTTSASVSITVQAAAAGCTASGTILREYWGNVSGSTVATIPVNTTPTATSQLTSFEAPTNVADSYGQRIRGYICAPTTGSYTFYISGDDDGELWLSTDDNAANKQRIAYYTGWTSTREWTRFSTQKSINIHLQANTKYYIEALHKEATGGDKLAVGWLTPGAAGITVIPGSVLSPVSTAVNADPTVAITSPTPGATFTTPASFGIQADAIDSDGTINKVAFFQGNILLGEDFTAPYSFSWSNVPAGTYAITAKATDNLGNIATSSLVMVTVQAATANCSASGSILREYWANINGSAVSTIPVNTVPTATSQLTSFEAPTNAADNYGQRIQGYICAPTTGNYTFYISGDDDAELWLSSDDNAANKQKIAFYTGWTSTREWTRFASQKSAIFTLQANTKYYIEALHKEASGGDKLAVGWLTPGATSIIVIPGSVLSPVNNTTTIQTISSQKNVPEVYLTTSQTFRSNPNPFSDKATIQFSFDRPETYKVMIYNMNGSLVKMLDSGKAEANTLVQLEWIDKKIPVGVYLVRLETKTGTQNLKIVRE